MSNVRNLPSADDRNETASLWLSRLDRGLSQAEEVEFKEWLSRNPENYRVFMGMAKLWDGMDALSRLSDICQDAKSPTRSRPRYAWKIAASFLFAMSFIVWSQLKQAGSDVVDARIALLSPEVFETAIGEQSHFKLPDGTAVVLNTNSLVTIEFTQQNRLLILERGEMHVSVAHDPSRPLSVMVGNKVVQAVGTEFNVEITGEDNIELVVTEGVVMVGILSESIAGFRSDQPMMLTPSTALVAAGQEVDIQSANDVLESVKTASIETEDIAVKLSWREGNLIFSGESLEEAVTEVGRYTAVEFVFLDEESKKVRVAGLFKAGDVEGLLSALRKNFNISYEWVGEDKIALSGE